jgi:hypothetical protein
MHEKVSVCAIEEFVPDAALSESTIDEVRKACFSDRVVHISHRVHISL